MRNPEELRESELLLFSRRIIPSPVYTDGRESFYIHNNKNVSPPFSKHKKRFFSCTDFAAHRICFYVTNSSLFPGACHLLLRSVQNPFNFTFKDKKHQLSAVFPQSHFSLGATSAQRKSLRSFQIFQILSTA